MKALITGAGGFIGGHLARNYPDVRAVDCKPLHEWHQLIPWHDNRVLDLKDPRAAEEAVKDVDIVFNLAADMGGMGFIEANKTACMLNVLINTNLLRAAVDTGVYTYFFASSACVYNTEMQAHEDGPALKEADAYPAQPEDGYGWEKLFSERMCNHFTRDFSIPTRVARFHNIYGPHGTYQGGREKAPAAICRKVIEAELSGNHEIEIWGNGEQTRSFTFIDDCINGIDLIAFGHYAHPLNLGSSERVSINQLVDIAEEISGIKLKRTYNQAAPRGVHGRNSDNTLIRNLYGWEPSIPLKSGLEKTYRWIYDQMAK